MQSSKKQNPSKDQTERTKSIATKASKDNYSLNKKPSNSSPVRPSHVATTKHVIKSKQEQNTSNELPKPLPTKAKVFTKNKKNLDESKMTRKPKKQVKCSNNTNQNALHQQARIISEQALSVLSDGKNTKISKVSKSSKLTTVKQDKEFSSERDDINPQTRCYDSFDDDEDFVEECLSSPAIPQISKRSTSDSSLMEVDDILNDVFPSTDSNSAGDVIEEEPKSQSDNSEKTDSGKESAISNSYESGIESDESGIQSDSLNDLQFSSESNDPSNEEQSQSYKDGENTSAEEKMEVDEFQNQSDQSMSSECETKFDKLKTQSKHIPQSRDDVYKNLKGKLQEKESKLSSKKPELCKLEDTLETPKSSKGNVKSSKVNVKLEQKTQKMNKSRAPISLPPLVYLSDNEDEAEFVTPVNIRIKPKLNLDPPKVQKYAAAFLQDDVGSEDGRILETLRQQYPQFEITMKSDQSPQLYEPLNPKIWDSQFSTNTNQNRRQNTCTIKVEELRPDSWEDKKVETFSPQNNSFSETPSTQTSTQPRYPFNKNEASSKALKRNTPLAEKPRIHYSEEQNRFIVENYAQWFIQHPGLTSQDRAEAIRVIGGFSQTPANFRQHIRRILKQAIYDRIHELQRSS